MDFKKMIPIVVLFTMSIVLAGVHPAFSSPVTSIVIVDDNTVPQNSIDIDRTQSFIDGNYHYTFNAMYYVDGTWKLLRYLDFTITDKNTNKTVYQDYQTTNLFTGKAKAKVDLRNWETCPGDYDLKVYHAQNDEWPEAEAHINVHIH